ncbi:hypothetical protein K456DRAFT_1208244 [Colletotrichum gloeosporioides 23]|nr:hypothetical protein K456DRAFT_1208244 [Colletotrichum gloeosporioides 23]
MVSWQTSLRDRFLFRQCLRPRRLRGCEHKSGSPNRGFQPSRRAPHSTAATTVVGGGLRGHRQRLDGRVVDRAGSTLLPRRADDVRPCGGWTAVNVNSHKLTECTEHGQGSGTIRRSGG